MKHFRFYLSQNIENLHQKEVLIHLDDLSDVMAETEKLCKYKGTITPTFITTFLDTLYGVYGIRPLYGSNFHFCLRTNHPREELHHVLWQVIRKSKLLPLVLERKVLNIIDSLPLIKQKHGADFIIRAVLDSEDAFILRKWGIEFQQKDVAVELGLAPGRKEPSQETLSETVAIEEPVTGETEEVIHEVEIPALDLSEPEIKPEVKPEVKAKSNLFQKKKR